MEAREVIKWLNICSKDNAGKYCKDCPYNDLQDHKNYEDGCGKLLADAAMLLSAAFPNAGITEFTVTVEGITAKVEGADGP